MGRPTLGARSAAVLCTAALLAAAPLPPAPVRQRLATIEQQGRAAYNQGDYRAALARWQPLLSEAARYGDDSQTAALAYEVSAARLRLQALPEAQASAERALALHRKLQYPASQLDDLDLLARIDLALGDYDGALRSLDDALVAIAADRQSHDTIVDPRAGETARIGSVELELGRADAALKRFEEARAIDDRTGFFRGVAYDNELRGEALLVLHRPSEALGAFRSALGGYENAVALAPWEVRESGHTESAVACLPAEGPRATPAAADRCGREPIHVYGDDILSSLLPGHDGAAAGEARTLVGIARAQAALGHDAEAAETLRRTLALDESLADTVHEAEALAELGLIAARLGGKSEAEQTSRRAERLAASIGAPTTLWKIAYTVARARTLLDDSTSAIAAFERAIGLIETVRAGLGAGDRSGFFESKLPVYDDYIAYLLDLDRRFPRHGYDAKALRIFERRTGRATLEQVGASTARRFRGADPRDVAAHATLEREIDEAMRQLASLRASHAPQTTAIALTESRLEELGTQRRALDARLRQHDPRYFGLLNPQPVDLDTLRRTLREGEVLLIYDVLPGGSVLWALDRKGLRTFRLPGAQQLVRAVRRVKTHLDIVQLGAANAPADLVRDAARDLPAFADDSRALARTLIPTGALAPSTGHVIVVPSGPLYDVAWEALVTRDPGSGTPHFFIEDHAVSYVPSASLLALVRQARPRPAMQPLLAFARPAVAQGHASIRSAGVAALHLAALRQATRGTRDDVFADLPGTQREADAVRSALGAPPQSVRLGEAASRASILALNAEGRLRDYRYLLFATHAVLPDQIQGLAEPAIVLAHPERLANLLTMGDVFGLELNADLVALSACNTGAGPHAAGDGISGLTRAFLYAGTPAIAVTLWQVYDAAAPEIVPPFFREMRAGLEPAEALRRAKVRLLRTEARFRHPFFWAPSVIFGDGDTSVSHSTSQRG